MRFRSLLMVPLMLFLYGCSPATTQCESQEAALQAATSSNSNAIVDNVVVVLDDSGSMDERLRSDRNTTKMEAAKVALVKVLDQLPSDAHVGVIMLSGSHGGRWLLPLGAVNKAQVTEKVQSIGAGGGTPLGERIKDGTDVLLTKRDSAHYGSYRLLVVTDGEANDQRLVDLYLPDIMSRGITVDVIGVDMAGDHSLATQVHNYRRADDPASLEAAIKETFAETPQDDPDAAEEDYELVAAFPDGMAPEVIKKLTQTGNHEIGELHDTIFDRSLWREIIAAFPYSPVEYLARAVKDLLADTNEYGTLQHIVRERKTASLAFYVAFLDGLDKEFFPQLPTSFQEFAQTRDWSMIDQAVSSGYQTATKHAGLIMDLYQEGVRKNELKWAEKQIQKRLLGKYMKKRRK